MTLVSTGTKSIFLNPTDALHGDIGVLGQDDILVLFSKSGSTEELLTLIPYAKAKGAKLVGVSSSKSSKIANMCDEHIYLPLERELCPFNLAPVTSTAIQMIFGDTCAVAIMQAKSISMDEYAMNHPAGRIGKRLILRVKDLMTDITSLPLVRPDDKGLHALVLLAGKSKGCGCLVVVDGQRKLLGTLADADMRRALAKCGESALTLSVEDMMNFGKSSPQTVSPNALAYDTLLRLERETFIHYLPVVHDTTAELLGLITLRQLVYTGL